MYKIEKNIPIPPRNHKPKGYKKDSSLEKTILNMDIYDSFLMSEKDSYRATNISHTIKKSNPQYKFTIRKVREGVRIWRVK